jgi:hypothetical protein
MMNDDDEKKKEFNFKVEQGFCPRKKKLSRPHATRRDLQACLLIY